MVLSDLKTDNLGYKNEVRDLYDDFGKSVTEKIMDFYLIDLGAIRSHGKIED